MKKYLSNEKGLTLIELVISIVIIGVILLGFFSLLIQSNKANRYSADTVNSTYVAQETMEVIYGAIRESKNISAFVVIPEISNNYDINSDCAISNPIDCTLKMKNNDNIVVQLDQMPSSNNLIRAVTTVSHDLNNDVIMESVWRWE